MATALSRVGHPQQVPDHECRIALVGFGTVGRAVARLLQAGSDKHNLRLAHICNRHVARKKVNWVDADVIWTESIPQVLASDADFIVELMGGLDVAYDLVRRALQAGKSVVTANKQLIAYHGPELLRLAADNGQYLGFGACVAGGVPVLSALQDGLAGDRLLQLRGILNGTCNYILTRIEAGASLADALRDAQQAGLAEADPSYDVDGQDAAAKLSILALIGLKIAVSPDQVVRRSIRGIEAIDFEYAGDVGCTIRQLSIARLTEGAAYLGVGPFLVPHALPFADVRGSNNLVVSTGEFGSETAFGGVGAGGNPTAVAVVSDLLHGTYYRVNRRARAIVDCAMDCDITRDLYAAHYLRFVVRDRPGIIAAIATVLAKHKMNLNAVLQKPGHEKSALPFVITVEPCLQHQLDTALVEIKRLDFLVEPPLVMPILE